MYLLSRGLDPVLGVLTGLLAYRIAERNPRSAPAEGDSLGELVEWKWTRWRAEVLAREQNAEQATEGWTAMANDASDDKKLKPKANLS